MLLPLFTLEVNGGNALGCRISSVGDIGENEEVVPPLKSEDLDEIEDTVSGREDEAGRAEDLRGLLCGGFGPRPVERSVTTGARVASVTMESLSSSNAILGSCGAVDVCDGQ